MTTPLVAFMRARLDAAEARALDANTEQARRPYGDRNLDPVPPEKWGDLVENYLGGAVGRYCATWSPQRVLAEIAAQRALLDLYESVAEHDGDHDYEWAYGYATGLGDAVRMLAGAHALHPDYQAALNPPRTPVVLDEEEIERLASPDVPVTLAHFWTAPDGETHGPRETVYVHPEIAGRLRRAGYVNLTEGQS